MTTAARESFDAIVVGSGFGGAVAACRLAQHGARVLVLERGRAWPPGSFPRTPRELRDRGFWEPGAGRLGLFDVHSFSGAAAITAAGLGGGSLIYANVCLRKDPSTFATERLDDGGHERWPLRAEDLEPGYEAAEAMLAPQRFPYLETPKTAAFAAAARHVGAGEVEQPPLAVAFAPEAGATPAPRQPVAPGAPNVHGAHRVTCRLCGECDVGCNDGAKQSLDHTYLSAAWAAGAQLRVGCEAVALAPDPAGGWRVTYVQRPELRDGAPEHLLDPDPAARRVTVRAPVVVLGAGTFGSTALLLRNRAALPGLSPRLGEGVSANGDVLAFAFGTRKPVHPSRGPVITTTLRVPGDASPSGREYLVQDAGSPVFAEWLWHLREVPGDLWRLRHTAAQRLWDRVRGRRDTDLGGELAEALGDAHASASMLPLLGMGRDVPAGRLTLRGTELDLAYDVEDSAAHYAAVEDACRAIAGALGGRYRSAAKLRTTTVHPLGGCGMGASWREGVVDDHGEVFGHRGLFVCDGAALPGAVGANPSLTIAAVAERCAPRMRERLA